MNEYKRKKYCGLDRDVCTEAKEINRFTHKKISVTVVYRKQRGVNE